MTRGSGAVSPADLVVTGSYSDKRFIDMMVPHHMMAIEMAQMELQMGTKPQLKRAARTIVSSQQAEVRELKAIRARLFGSAATPAEMSKHQMDNIGMLSMSHMMGMKPFDKAFIDGMIPHHAAAIDMANVVLMQSHNGDLRRIARSIIVAQSTEIGDMIGWRLSWYGAS